LNSIEDHSAKHWKIKGGEENVGKKLKMAYCGNMEETRNFLSIYLQN
jgi:hypothetical protein